MSYTKGMGSTATDAAAVASAAATAAAQIIAAATGTSLPAASTTVDPTTGMPYGTLNPATGMPYGAINPATGRPYGEIEETSYMPFVIGALVLAGVGGYLLTRRRPTPNRRRTRMNGKRKTKSTNWRGESALKCYACGSRNTKQVDRTTRRCKKCGNDYAVHPQEVRKRV